MNEQALIRSLQNGDQLAFKELVESRQHMVFNTVLSIVQDWQEAEDLSQEVFIQIYQSIKDFRGEAKLSTWIYRVAITKALDAERKKKSRKRMADLRSWMGLGDKEEMLVHFHHPGVALDNKERAAVLFKALRQLPENQRIAFTLIKAENLSYEETAAVMNITTKAVEALMHRAKEKLRQKLIYYYSIDK